MELYQILLRKLQFPPTGYSLLNPVCASVLDGPFFAMVASTVGQRYCLMMLATPISSFFPLFFYFLLLFFCFFLVLVSIPSLHVFILSSQLVSFQFFFNFLFFSSIPLTFYLFIFPYPYLKLFFTFILSFLIPFMFILSFFMYPLNLFFVYHFFFMLYTYVFTLFMYYLFCTHKVIVKRDKSIIPKNINFCST